MTTAIRSEHPIPRAFIVGAAFLMVATIVAATTARWTGVGRLENPAFVAAEVVDLTFRDRADGGIDVVGAGTVTTLDPGTNGFVRGVLRGFARDRRARGAGPEAPFRLFRSADGQVLIGDTVTGRVLDLVAFGATNEEAFAKLFPRS